MHAKIQIKILSPSTFKGQNTSWTFKIWVGHRLLFFCPLIRKLKAWFFNCNEKTWPRCQKILFPILCFEGINFKTWFPPNRSSKFLYGHQGCLMVIGNYGINFRPDPKRLQTHFLKWKNEKPRLLPTSQKIFTFFDFFLNNQLHFHLCELPCFPLEMRYDTLATSNQSIFS